MPSKMVNDRQKSSASVEASVTTHGQSVADKLAKLLAPPVLEIADIAALDSTGGESVGVLAAPDFHAFLQSLRAHLGSLREDLARADEAHLEELADDDGPRRRRDEAAMRLRDSLRGLRDSLGGIFGAERRLEMVGVESVMAQDPAALAAQVKRVIERLSSPGLRLEDPRFPGFQIEAAALVEILRPDYEQLTEALAEVTLEEREAEVTLTAKQRALDAYDDGFRWTATALEALYSLAGETEIGDRIRPSRRRPGQTEALADAEPEDDANGNEESEKAPETPSPAASEDAVPVA